MDYLNSLLDSFVNSPSSRGYDQAGRQYVNEPEALDCQSPRIAYDPETQSASVDLEDLISEYDEPSSRRSQYDAIEPASIEQGRFRSRKLNTRRSSMTIQSLPSSSNLISTSQSYKTARESDETISFYSALYDGFSLDEYEWKNRYGQDFFWSSRSQNLNGERDSILQATNFKVLWCDLTYTINRPITNIYNVWHETKRKFCNFFPKSTQRLPEQSEQNQTDHDSQREKLNPNETDPCGQQDPRSGVTIIEHLNGSFRSGQLTAIMGPSGAGKTSLLNILSRRSQSGLTGSLQVESEDSMDRQKLEIISIPQHDHLPEYLTVRENLMFASRLKNPGANHEANVLRVSELLGLDDCLDTKTQKISGGQQKRLAIAQELLSRPHILILDEPTSGLDSSTCIKTLSVLKDLVRASARKIIDPIAIVLTIHQPQQEAFELFDKVYVMANGGVAIYDGPPSDCVQFVQRYANISLPSSDYNPASFMIDIASGEYGDEAIKALQRQVCIEFEKQLNRKCKSRGVSFEPDHASISDQGAKIDATGALEANSSMIFHELSNKSLYLDSRLVKGSEVYSGHFFYKIGVLTERCWRSMVRHPHKTILQIMFHLFLPFGLAFMMGLEPGQANACPKYREEYTLMGIVKSDDYTNPEVQAEFLLALENIGVIFITIYSCISANIAAATLAFTLDLNTSIKEYYNGWYTMNSYLFARLLSQAPLDLILPTATMALMYTATGQNTGFSGMPDIYRIIITALAVVLGSVTGQLMGMIFGAIYMGHTTTALFASQGATLPFVLLSGFVARTKNMSKFVRVLSMSSLFKHCLEISFIARYGWNVCGCDPAEATGREPRITGVPEKLSNFVDYWQNSQLDETQLDRNESYTKVTQDQGLFGMMAKQISLYNTYGIDVQSCEQVVPYELNDFGLTEADLPYSFAALISLSIVVLFLLMLVINFLTTYRTSL